MPPTAVGFVVHVLCIVSMVSSDLHVFSLKNRDQDILKMSSPTIGSTNSLAALPDAQPPSGSSSLEASYVSDSAPRCAVCCCRSFSSWLWPSAQPRNGRDEGFISLMATSKLVCVDEEAEGLKKNGRPHGTKLHARAEESRVRLGTAVWFSTSSGYY